MTEEPSITKDERAVLVVIFLSGYPIHPSFIRKLLGFLDVNKLNKILARLHDDKKYISRIEIFSDINRDVNKDNKNNLKRSTFVYEINQEFFTDTVKKDTKYAIKKALEQVIQMNNDVTDEASKMKNNRQIEKGSKLYKKLMKDVFNKQKFSEIVGSILTPGIENYFNK